MWQQIIPFWEEAEDLTIGICVSSSLEPSCLGLYHMAHNHGTMCPTMLTICASTRPTDMKKRPEYPHPKTFIPSAPWLCFHHDWIFSLNYRALLGWTWGLQGEGWREEGRRVEGEKKIGREGGREGGR